MDRAWIEIGQRDSSKRRSLWMRVTPNSFSNYTEIQLLELCAGREGDDEYVRIDKTNPQFDELLKLFLTAKMTVDR